MKMKLTLVAGLSEENKKKVYSQYQNSELLLIQLRNIVKKEIESSYVDEEKEVISLENIANTFGYRRGLRKILNYIPEE